MDIQQQMGGPLSLSTPSSRVELRFKCYDLTKKDLASKSDPMLVMFYDDPKSPHCHEVFRTEVVKNNHNPVFSDTYVMEYYFETVQNLRFELYDVDSKDQELCSQDYLGEASCTLAKLASGRQPTMLDLIHRKKPDKNKHLGHVIITCEELKDCNVAATFSFRGSELDKKDFFGKSDPYLEIQRLGNDGKSWELVYRSEFVKKTLDPTWKPFTLGYTRLCNGDIERKLRIQTFDYDRDGSHDFIGECETSVKEIREMWSSGTMTWELINRKKQEKKKKYKNSGVLRLDSFREEETHTFLEYVMGGCEINFTVAVDFTGSNGNPSSPGTLHYAGAGPTLYEHAICAVGNVIQYYDTDQYYPALGFGGIPQGANDVSHAFPLNGNPDSPYCVGIGGIVNAYRHCINTVRLYGPTNFTPVIRDIMRFAQQHSTQDNQKYYILLILTDGQITDEDSTIRAIVEASKLPMSIIIVGIGGADFSAMENLDGDDGRPLSYRGTPCERDIVQFVEFSKYARDHSHERFAAELLAEIPTQFLSYMKKHGIVPNAVKPMEVFPSSETN